MEKTIERLALYRRLLKNQSGKGNTHIFSHQLAGISGYSAAIVRRDLMNIGYYGTPRHGYEIKALIDCLNVFFNKPEVKSLILVGAGNLGRALIAYFIKDKTEYNLIAAFDSDPLKVNLKYNGCPCYSLEKIPELIAASQASVGIITVPAENAQSVADLLVENKIKGILNFAPVSLTVPESVYVENVDLALMLEKVLYFSVHHREGEKKNGMT
ncbi:MAG: redox-sensing transcriptional repressor Rex [Spirochaetales bacterium]|nr:redox-sensing transcriptional repressor Rex [Spirochaetales bacterium]